MATEIIASFDRYNFRRYSGPWVCIMTPTGQHDFSKRVGMYTGNAKQGEAGALVVFDPVVGQVYGYGQKDYRGNNTLSACARWDGTKFVPCDKLGRTLKQ